MVKVAHSLAYISLVVPVMSSHWAWSVPPVTAVERAWGTVSRGQRGTCTPGCGPESTPTPPPLPSEQPSSGVRGLFGDKAALLGHSCLSLRGAHHSLAVSSRLPRCRWKELLPRRQGGAGAPLTNDAAEQPQAGGVSLPAVPRVICPGGREWDAKPDGAVELAAPWLHGDNGAEGGLVAQEFGDQLIGYRLGL